MHVKQDDTCSLLLIFWSLIMATPYGEDQNPIFKILVESEAVDNYLDLKYGYVRRKNKNG